MPIDPNNTSTINVDQLPPGAIDLTSKIPIGNGTDLQTVTAQEMVDFVNIYASRYQFEIIDLWVSQAFIDTNFNSTGLGILIMTGTAICNGLNATPNLDGQVSVGYGTNYNVIKAIGGNKQVTLGKSNIPKIDTTLPVSNAGGGGSPYTYVVASGSGTPATKTYADASGQSSPNPINNMQPYMVLLKIMKL